MKGIIKFILILIYMVLIPIKYLVDLYLGFAKIVIGILITLCGLIFLLDRFFSSHLLDIRILLNLFLILMILTIFSFLYEFILDFFKKQIQKLD